MDSSLDPTVDPVIKELDVQFHHSLDGKIHLLTYPLKQANNPPILPSTVRMRPSRRIFETDYPLDIYGDNFDSIARGDTLASRTRLKSTEVSFKALHTIGIVQGNTLHLAPITSIQQLRPDMSQLDVNTTDKNKNSNHDSSSSSFTKRNNSSSNGNSTTDPVRVTTTFRRAVNDERVEAFRRATYAFHTAQEEADNFIHLHPHDAASSLAKHIKTKLTETLPSSTVRSLSSPPSVVSSSGISLTVDAQHDPSSSLVFSSSSMVTAEQYLRATANRGILPSSSAGNSSGSGTSSFSSASIYDTMPNIPIPHGTTTATAAASAGTITLTQLIHQPLVIQIEEILRRSHAVPFHRLLEFTTAATSLSEILSALDKLGRYVRDCWVLRSDLFYQPHWSHRSTNVRNSGTGTGNNGNNTIGTGNPLSHHHHRPRGRPLNSHTSLYAGLKPSVISRLQLLRDYILCLFNRSPVINLDEIIYTIGSDEEIRILIAILETLAVQDTPGSRVWVWKRYLLNPVSDSPRDETLGGQAFALRFPQEVERAQRYWKRRETELLAHFSQHHNNGPVSDASDHGDELMDENSMVEDTKPSLVSMELSSSSSSSKPTTTGTKSKSRSYSATSNTSNISMDDPEPSTTTVRSSSASASATTNLSDAAPLPAILSTPKGSDIINRMPSVAYQHLRGFIIDTLSQRGICTRGYLLRQIWLQRETDPPKAFYTAIANYLKISTTKLVIQHAHDHQGTGIAIPEGVKAAVDALNSLLADIAVEIPTISTVPVVDPHASTGGSKRTASSSSSTGNTTTNTNNPATTVVISNEPRNDDINGAVISISSGDISVDQYRPIFIRQLLRQPRSRRTDIRRAIENTFGGQDPSSIIYNKILKEVAISSNNVWNIKTGEEDPPIILP